MTTEGSALTEGIRLFQGSDLQGARTCFEEAVVASPADGKAHGYLGIVLTRLGDSNRGISELQEAVRLQPSDSSALYNLAVALVQVGRKEDARGALEYALTIDPSNARVQAALNQLAAAPASAAAGYGMPTHAAVVSMPPANYISPASPGYGAAPPTAYSSQPASIPATYGAAPRPYGVQPPPYGVGGRPSSVYVPPATQPSYIPTAGQRIGRGIGWGMLLGQSWTLWLAIRLALGLATTNTSGVDGSIIGLGFAVLLILGAIMYAFIGAVAGLVIGATDAAEDTASIVGIVASIIAMAAQYLLGGRTAFGIIFGIFLAISIGKWFGTTISRKAQGA